MLPDLQRLKSTLERAIKTVGTNQERLRKNLMALEKHGKSKLAQRYMDDMNNEEDDLIRNRKKVETTDDQIRQVQQVCCPPLWFAPNLHVLGLAWLSTERTTMLCLLLSCRRQTITDLSKIAKQQSDDFHRTEILGHPAYLKFVAN